MSHCVCTRGKYLAAHVTPIVCSLRMEYEIYATHDEYLARMPRKSSSSNNILAFVRGHAIIMYIVYYEYENLVHASELGDSDCTKRAAWYTYTSSSHPPPPHKRHIYDTVG